MSVIRVVAAAILALIGFVWIGQGIGMIPGSFMTSDVRWAVAGVVLLVIAGVLAWSARGSAR